MIIYIIRSIDMTILSGKKGSEKGSHIFLIKSGIPFQIPCILSCKGRYIGLYIYYMGSDDKFTDPYIELFTSNA